MYTFIDHTIKPNYNFEKIVKDTLLKSEEIDRDIIVLRPILFFYTTQVITLAKLREFFTNHAITKLMGDGFIKFKHEE